jgi:hypothetical protein
MEKDGSDNEPQEINQEMKKERVSTHEKYLISSTY